MNKKASVVALRKGATLSLGQPVPEIVELFEKHLAQAKRGEIIGAAVVSVMGNNDIVIDPVCGRSDMHLISAGCARLSHRVLDAWSEFVE